MAPGDRALLEERVVAAVVDAHLVLGEVELDHAGDAPGEELAVVRDQHDAAAEALDERLEPGEPVEVEVVGGLVEEHHVEAAQQQRGQRDARRLAAGQRRHEGVGADVEAEVVEHRGDPVVEVGGAARHPAVERHGVGVVGARVAGAEGGRGRLHVRGRPGRAGAAGDVVRDRLARHPLVLLREEADEGVAGRARHRPRHRLRGTAQQRQQRRLAGAVGTDHPDHVARGDGEVEALEEHAVTVSAGQVLGDERGRHGAEPTGPPSGG